jgi:hypothetical protein
VASHGASSPLVIYGQSFAEGRTQSGFETWILIQNPNDSPANVNMTYLTPTGLLAGSQ